MQERTTRFFCHGERFLGFWGNNDSSKNHIKQSLKSEQINSRWAEFLKHEDKTVEIFSKQVLLNGILGAEHLFFIILLPDKGRCQQEDTPWCASTRQAFALLNKTKADKAAARRQKENPRGQSPWGVVPVMGVEPIRCFQQRILSPSRLPIPTHRHMCVQQIHIIHEQGGEIKKKIFFLGFAEKQPAKKGAEIWKKFVWKRLCRGVFPALTQKYEETLFVKFPWK